MTAELTRAAQQALNAGRYDEAARHFRELARLQPQWAMHWANLGTALRATGDYDEALRAYTEAAERGAASSEFLLNFALLRMDRFEYGQARALLAQSAASGPGSAEVRYFLAICDFQNAQDEQAQRALGDWRTLEGLTVDMLARIGTLLMQLGLTDQAGDALVEALRRHPRHPLATVRLAQLMERTNRVAEAEALLAGLSPTAAGAHGELHEERLACEARLAERREDWAGARARYERLLAEPQPQHLRYHVLYPLGRVLEKLGEVEAAMATFAAAHDSQAAFLARAAPQLAANPQPSFNIANYPGDAADFARWAEDPGPDVADSPIFIVGFPRSGTTLMEQMLDAHPALVSMDEQPFLQQAIDAIRDAGVAYPERLADLTPGQCAAVREGYWQRVNAKVRRVPGQRLVDKNPLNLLRLPAIRRLFPRAPIVLAIRHPFDVLVSNYQQHYRAPEIALMCRDFTSLARGYRRAFDFWYAQQALLQPRVHELLYEDLVGDFAACAARLAEFLGVPLAPAMLEPGRHALKRGYISTPSYFQVVEPVNRRAVGRWRKYARHLEPAREILRPYLERWGYES
jgi:tetratricopeptide (TPR) repeat protein